MSKVQKSWPIDAFDAVSIQAYGCQLDVTGVETDRVTLESDEQELFNQAMVVQTVDRWLEIQLMDDYINNARLRLILPRQKTWTLDVSSGWGEVDVRDLAVRLRVNQGKGDTEIRNCQGIFAVWAGNGNLKMEDCRQIELPERPPMPSFDQRDPANTPSTDRPYPLPQDWANWTGEDWSVWGRRFGEQAMNWGIKVGQYFSTFGRGIAHAGLSASLGKGDVTLERVSANSCTVTMSKGNLKVHRGVIRDLYMSVSHGDFDSSAVLPLGVWSIKTNHGDMRLALPADTNARIDAATRSGDIRSDFPLVRVPRQGPETEHGMRLVGSIGQTSGQTAQINMNATHAHIRLELQREASAYPAPETAVPSSNPAPDAAEPVTAAAGDAGPAVPDPLTGEPLPEEPSVQTSVEAVPQSAAAPQPQDTQLAILTALSEGKISVSEAEALLKNL